MAPDSGARTGPGFDGAQLGEVELGDSAGRDIVHGARADELLAFIKDIVWRLDQRSSVQIDALQRQVAQLETETLVLRIIVLVGLIAYLALLTYVLL